jgi:tetratricopeptide (TPR) repeat protein
LIRKIFCCLTIFSFVFASAQKKQKDSLLAVLHNTNNDSVKCQVLTYLILIESDNTIWPAYNTELKALGEKGSKSSNQGAKIYFLEALSSAITNEGFLKQQTGKFSEAIADFRKSLEIKFDIHDRTGVADNLVNIGYIYFAVGDYSKAADCYKKCLKIQEELKNKEAVSLTLVNLANVFLRQSDTVKFLELVNKALGYRKETNDKIGIGNCYNAIGMIEVGKGNINAAFGHCNDALKIFEELEYKDGISNSINNLGGIYRRMGELEKAEEFYKKALKINLEIQDNKSASNSFLNLGDICERKKDNAGARKYYSEAMKYAKICGEIREIKMAANALYLFEKMLGHKKEADKMFNLYRIMKDSLEKKVVINIEENPMNSLFEEPFKEEIILENKPLVQSENNNTYFIIGLAVLAAILAIYFAFKKRG